MASTCGTNGPLDCRFSDCCRDSHACASQAFPAPDLGDRESDLTWLRRPSNWIVSRLMNSAFAACQTAFCPICLPLTPISSPSSQVSYMVKGSGSSWLLTVPFLILFSFIRSAQFQFAKDILYDTHTLALVLYINFSMDRLKVGTRSSRGCRRLDALLRPFSTLHLSQVENNK